MKVTKTTVSDSEIASFIDLELPTTMSRSSAQIVKNEVGELLLDYILKRVANAKNPFTGESYQGLSKDYRDEKKDSGAPGKANLENSGDMLDEFKYSTTDEGVKLFVDGDQAPKADGHNNFSGQSKLPKRQFLPMEGDTFPSQVEREVQAIIAENMVSGSNITRSAINEIRSRSQLNEFLRSSFPDLSIREAKNAILLDRVLMRLFDPVLEFF